MSSLPLSLYVESQLMITTPISTPTNPNITIDNCPYVILWSESNELKTKSLIRLTKLKTKKHNGYNIEVDICDKPKLNAVN
mmetsp:Transcript_8647/g.10788  ORF Transcript_8647/g.10788 Transcript_8647/m.10788 type:complete len:81 (-) Transcript_8647:848-1090(-)